MGKKARQSGKRGKMRLSELTIHCEHIDGKFNYFCDEIPQVLVSGRHRSVIGANLYFATELIDFLHQRQEAGKYEEACKQLNLDEGIYDRANDYQKAVMDEFERLKAGKE